MAEKSIYNQTVALSGLFQVCEQVRDLANDGKYSTEALKTAIDSIFKIDAKNVWDVYGDRFGLAKGAKMLVDQFTGHIPERDIQITRLISAILNMERQLNSEKQALRALQSAISQSHNAFSLDDDYDIATTELARAYTRIISPIGRKIMVQGNPTYLQNEHNAKKIRVFLLAGIRSAVLWRQCGGNQFKFIWQRGKHIATAKEIANG